ncbi:MAG: ribosomal RNA small subunit methyltransferase A [Gemmatimonadaceae bacterium]|nr:ribosomal RNA small subunit methyltransferase A [Gemmatimonadaceae bacterium]MDQ3243000.1 16S rRNA (adenine(1518)-N(6)/adenine(1519)-N(6))-dimethyltransferase RsmA [Gemmatimonadota bacterium]
MPRRQRTNPPVLKRFGQHFLHDAATLQGIADAVAPIAGETVIEIGPGRGALTELLARRSERLVAVEIDRELSMKLEERYADDAHVLIVEGDVLDADLALLAEGPFVVAGNVPYYITTPILFHVLQPPYPRHAVFLVQQEVADRIASPPGSRTYGALSVNVQAIADAEIVRRVPPSAFRPPPKVDSAVIRITPKRAGLITAEEVRPFRSFVQAAFGMRRKQLLNVIRAVRAVSAADAVSVLEREGIDPSARPETITPAQFASLMRATSDRAT